MVQGEVNVVKGEFLIGFRLGRHYQVGIVFYIQLLGSVMGYSWYKDRYKGSKEGIKASVKQKMTSNLEVV